MKKTALVTGGAGYIGSHCVAALRRAGWETVTLDNLSTGYAKAVEGEIVVGNTGDAELLDELFDKYRFNAVLHFAGYIAVGESAVNPMKYYDNNVARSIPLLAAMIKHGVRRLIFSSTAAVYGNPVETPITETHPIAPINPYGVTKSMFERMVMDAGAAHGLTYVFLRYFNAAGADPSGARGEGHEPETHLIPLVIKTSLGMRESVTIYGNDYPTKDGTCVRDYIHVSDLCQAHLDALLYLENGGESGAFNLGNSVGFTVREIIKTVERVSGKKVNAVEGERREGDAAILIASNEKAKRVLGWTPRFEDMGSIIETAYKWHRDNPTGYRD